MGLMEFLENEPHDVPIVAIGASAGGIIALQKLFTALPAHPECALVVLQHLPADPPSRLADLLARWTSMDVQCATDGTRPQPNIVYVPSAGCILTLEKGVFHTRPAQGGARRPGIDTIDAFLESLALKGGSRPVAVILSGTGMDGTAGAVCVRRAGGVVIVQDPLTALHNGMPNAVIQRGIHDHILPAGAIGPQIAICVDPEYVRPAQSSDWTGSTAKTLDRIIDRIQRRVGFNLSGYKPSPLLWRIQQRMEVRKVWAFDDYALLMEDDPVELETLVRGIPIQVTEFFRDAEGWKVLRDEVLAPLVSSVSGRRQIRVWTAGCSTGEEAYSVGMLLDEVIRANGLKTDFQIFASDAAPELVARASRGIFREEAVATIPADLRERHFYRVDGAFRVRRLLRERMIFITQDLLSDPPFSEIDLVTCRNLLIYLEAEKVEDVLHLLHGSLQTRGVLFLGKSEPFQLAGRGFEAASQPWNIYRKTGPMPGARRKPAVSHRALTASTFAAVALRLARGYVSD